LALGFGWWSDPAVFVHVANPHSAEFVMVVLAIHLIGIIAIAGAALYMLNVSAARMTSLAAAVGWVLIAAVHGGGITWPLALVTLLSSAAGAIGFLPYFREQQSTVDLERPSRRSARQRRDAEVASERSAASHPVLDSSEDHSKPFVPPPPSWPTPTVAGQRTWTTDLPSRNPPRKPSRPRRRREVVAGAFGLVVVLLGGATFGYIVWSVTEPKAELARPIAKEPRSAAAAPDSAPDAASSDERLQTAGLPSLPPALSPAAAAGDVTGNLGSIPPTAASTQVAALPEVPAPTATSPVPAPAAGSFATPGDYCASNTNIDAPDLGKVSGGTQDLYVKARAAAKLAQGDVHWRCMDGAVWTCATTAGGLACDKIPTSVDRVLICAAHPDASGIRTAGGDWSCDGFTPVVTPAQLQASDRRGFDKEAWHKLS
jgi:hypothetical protein